MLLAQIAHLPSWLSRSATRDFEKALADATKQSKESVDDEAKEPSGKE